jgi:hypothetical protein
VQAADESGFLCLSQCTLRQDFVPSRVPGSVPPIILGLVPSFVPYFVLYSVIYIVTDFNFARILIPDQSRILYRGLWQVYIRFCPGLYTKVFPCLLHGFPEYYPGTCRDYFQDFIVFCS